MKIKDLIKLLEKEEQDKEVVIRFCLSENDEVGYALSTVATGHYGDKIAIYADYTATKEDCEYVGQFDLATLWENEYNKLEEE